MAVVQNPLWKLMGWNVQGDLGGWTFYFCRNRGLIFFMQAPPTTPATPVQLHRRNRWRVWGEIWQSWPQEKRDAWKELGERAHLRITYYALFVYYQETHDAAIIHTLEKQTGVTVPLV